MTNLVSHFSLLIPWVCETQIFEWSWSTFGQSNYATDTPRWMNVNLMSVLGRRAEKKTSINFHMISTYFFDVVSMSENWRPFHVLCLA